jgi:hypothetical protein
MSDWEEIRRNYPLIDKMMLWIRGMSSPNHHLSTQASCQRWDRLDKSCLRRRNCASNKQSSVRIVASILASVEVARGSVDTLMGETVVCCKPPRVVLYKCTYVPYNGTFGTSDQGQTLDV